jgi:hypothetical protein
MLHLVLIMSPKDQGLFLKVNDLCRLPTPKPLEGEQIFGK